MNILDSLTLNNNLTAPTISAETITAHSVYPGSISTYAATFQGSITIGRTTYSVTQLESLFNHLLTLYPELSL